MSAHKKIIIGVAGEIASGTTTFASYAADYFGASTYRFSIPLRDVIRILKECPYSWKQRTQIIAKRLSLPINLGTLIKLSDCIHDEFGIDYTNMKVDRNTLQRLSTVLRQTVGEDCLARAILSDLQKDTEPLIIVEGVRRLTDIENLRKLPNFIFIYVDADFDTRLKRVQDRKQYKDEVGTTRPEFQATCDQESESQIRALKECASVIIHNDAVLGESGLDGLDRYHNEINRVLTTITAVP